MITVLFFESEGKPSGFEIKGHALFAAHGSDIVCSAASSAAIMAANTITEVFGEPVEVQAGEGHLLLKGAKSQSSQGVLSGLKLHLQQLAEQYPANITVS
ncbi:MAG: ribosomal-processing cysteine protease Prp [Clostridia bacterium]|nr:ribosomal-processing cysteine protease Prp [Clostridia bacterium]